MATKLDVLQAQQVLDTANAQIPDLERQIAQEENAISILLGNYPQGVPRGRPLVEQALPPEVPPGLPSSLIERRPDIREAEQNLVAANAEIGVAKAAVLSANLSDRIRRRFLWSKQRLLQPHELAAWHLVLRRAGEPADFHRRRAARESAAGRVAAPAGLDRLPGSDSARVRRRLRCADRLTRNSIRSEFASRTTVADLQESVRLSNLRYKGGTTTYLEVLDGQRSLFTAELTLAAGARERIPEPRAALQGARRRLAAIVFTRSAVRRIVLGQLSNSDTRFRLPRKWYFLPCLPW